MKILNIIKKFFALILSFLFDSKSEKNKKKKTYKKEKSEKKEKTVQVQNYQNISNKDHESNIKQDKNIIYVKDDLQKIYNIINTIEKIKLKLRKTIDNTEIEKLKKEIDIIKSDLEFIESKYNKEKVDDDYIHDIKKKIEDCKILTETVEKEVNDIKPIKEEINNKADINLDIDENETIEDIKISKDEDKKIDNIEKSNNDVKQNNENNKLSSKVGIVDSFKPIDNPNKTAKESAKAEEKQVINKSNNETKKEKITIIDDIENIVIYDNPDYIDIKVEENDELKEKKQNVKKENSKEEKQNIIKEKPKENVKKIEEQHKEPKTIKIVDLKTIKQSQINLVSFKKKLKEIRKRKKIKLMSNLLNNAIKITGTLNLLSFMKNNNKIIESNLMINNYVRKARNIKNKLVRPLGYKKIQKVTSQNLNTNGQVLFIMNDTLVQINKLKQELNTYDMTDSEILNILEQLNEIELRIKEEYQNLDKKLKVR